MNTDNTNPLAEYVEENHDFIARVLAYGDTEARGYALTVLANGGKVQDVEQIQRLLEELKQQLEE